MSPRTPGWPEAVHDFLLRRGLREHPALVALREETDRLEHANMRSSAEQMQLVAFLLETMGATRVLEIGCFTGYGALAMALALPPDGRVVTLDVNEDWAAIGRRFWRQAGVEERIEFRCGEALATLEALLREGAAGTFDFVYVDADKKSYPRYYELGLRLLREGGVLAADNVLWGGAVADPSDRSRQVEAIRRFLDLAREDPDVGFCTLPIGDGLALVRKRPQSG